MAATSASHSRRRNRRRQARRAQIMVERLAVADSTGRLECDDKIGRA